MILFETRINSVIQLLLTSVRQNYALSFLHVLNFVSSRNGGIRYFSYDVNIFESYRYINPKLDQNFPFQMIVRSVF